ncbi:Sec34-domain-containing protein [Wolfiporia cocos MD-104 SS10]|uniref:Conserved oligomeric Golgi complex subunit 3 n=1 Tax=Wolfiporia cocos (strain MD-104) TaxID=742152 RepID=A0A2H3J2N0_WOLCO|nr:Sec34-domain-containing protein [Wolfiporia cocos MD-104 SS10]
MASSTASKRALAPTSLTPYAKPIITVEEWEAKAPLGDVETRSVALVKAASERAALPPEFSIDEPGSSSRPATPTARNREKLGLGSRPGTPSARHLAAHALHPKQPIQTPQQFYDWFALIDRSVAHSQEAHFRTHLENVSEHLETCDGLIQRIDEVDAAIGSMLKEWRVVEEGGKNLKDACEELLDERERLLSMTEAINERLEYFQELEHATRLLNSPGDSLVLQTDFLYMVERVDICIDYLKAHRHFREADIYLLRYQQCMTRAMTLIKMYFVGSLKALTADVTKRISEKDVSATAQMHLLYTRFYTVSAQLAPLLSEIERRATAHPEELSSLLSECHSAYFAARKALLVNRLMEEIKGLDPARTELVELTRSGCSYLKQLCTDEFSLFRAFFNSGEEQLYQYLENLCDYLYDDLRPRILHEPRLTALCEVCTVLQALMVLDIPALPDDEEEDEEEAIPAPNTEILNLDLQQRPVRGGRRGLRALQISHLLQMVLQDAQTRLFFKAQAVIQSDIRYYVPKAEDLAYPDKLISARKPVSGLEMKEKESVSQLFQLKSLDKQDTWYPTLQKTLWVLSQLHDFVNPAIFDDIAREALNLCRQSLMNAAETLKSKNPPTSTLDGQLFLVRYLLILKEMTQNLDLKTENPERKIDLSGVTETLASMLGRTTSLMPLPNALWTTLGMPRDENMVDVRLGIDHELKRACEELITSCAEPVCAPLRAWNERVRAYRAAAPTLSKSLSDASVPSLNRTLSSSSTAAVSAAPGAELKQPITSQPWATTDAVSALSTAFHGLCATELRAAIGRLRLYLEDERTVNVLVGLVQEEIRDAWSEWRAVVKEVYGSGGGEVNVDTEDDIKVMLQGACDENNGPNTAGTSTS